MALHYKILILINAFVLTLLLGTSLYHTEPPILLIAATVATIGANIIFFLDSIFEY